MPSKITRILLLLLFIAVSKNSMAQNVHPAPVSRTNIPLVGIKTNLLYWSGFTPEMKWKQVLPNLSLELFLGRRWSVTLDGAYTLDLRNGMKNKRYGFSSFGSEVRTWLKADHLFRGFYGGIYGNGGEFDVSPKSMDRNGHTGNYVGTGLTAGYTYMFNRWLGVEAGIRGGFRHVAYDVYQRASTHYYYERTKYKNSVCLDGVFLSLTARIGKYKK